MSIPSWVKVGAKCVCVDDIIPREPGYAEVSRYPIKGDTYNIDQVSLEDGRIWLTLAELGEDNDFDHFHFRPLISQSDDIAMFKAIADGALNPVVPPAVVPPRVPAPSHSD